MSPQKPFDVLVDEVIETDLRFWIEEKHDADLGNSVEPEQLEFDNE